MTRTRLLGQQEKGGERSTQRAREAGPPRREEGWAPEEGGQQVLEGLWRGDSEYWRGWWGAGRESVGRTVAVGTGAGLCRRSTSALVRSVLTVYSVRE